MPNGYRQLAKLACFYSLVDTALEVQFAERQLDRNLPGARGTDEYLRGSRDRVTNGYSQLAVSRPPPQEDMGVEEQPQCLPSTPKAASRSAGKGASKSSAIQTFPRPRPGRRRSRGCLSGTSRARGFPSLAMIISSPAAASSTRCDSLVFAS